MFRFIYKPIRRLIKRVIAPKIIDEKPKNAWPEKYINVKDRIVMDLGCGFFGKINQFPNVDIGGKKYTDMIPTTEYFLSLGAKTVIGYDENKDDIDHIQKKFGAKVKMKNKTLNHRKQFEYEILSENIEVIKSDIEGAEIHLLKMDEEVFKLIREYYVETHDKKVFKMFLKKFKKCHYGIRHIMRQEQGGSPSIIFAYRERWL